MVINEYPILFSRSMVQAIFAGHKSQTRRAMNPQPADDIAPCVLPNPNIQGFRSSLKHQYGPSTVHLCPFGKRGGRLWVRETWRPAEYSPDETVYFADIPDVEAKDIKAAGFKFRPSIHMPRSRARLFLEVTNIRVERLQDISEDDARAEGVMPLRGDGRMATGLPASCGYADLWDSLNAKRMPWESNPWVWVVEFKREGI